MQKRIGKTAKFYLTITMVILLIIALSVSLYFTLAIRSSQGTNKGGNEGTVTQMSAQVVSGTSTKDKLVMQLLSGTSTSYQGGIQIKNTSPLEVYVRAKVTLVFVTDINGTTIDASTSTDGMYFTYDEDNWTYAADNYLYYKNALATNASTTDLFKSLIHDSNNANKYVRIYITAEVIQEQAATPSVTISGDSSSLSNQVSTKFSQGLIHDSYDMSELASEQGTRTITITNNGKVDLDVKVRIASSEWTVKSATIGGEVAKVVRDANNGYYSIIGKLATKDTNVCVLTLEDANKNNGQVAGATNITFILQDYVLANDFYSIVDSNLQNIGTNNNGVITLQKAQLTNAKVYSYNNVAKTVYVKTTVSNGTVATYGADWAYLVGQNTAISGSAIPAKDTSSTLFDSAWVASLGNGTTVNVKIWTAIPVQSPTVELVQQSGLGTSSTGYGQVLATGSTVTSSSLVVSSISDTNIKNAWSNIGIKSNDYSDLLVRVSMAFVWGSLNRETFTPNATQPNLNFNVSQYYGKGFSYVADDGSLTYIYNLQNNNVSSPILEFPSDITAFVNALNTAKSSITSGGNAVKLQVMVEAVYAEGSQLDVLDISSATSKIALTDYYVDIQGATSMTDEGAFITYNPNTSIDSWNNYVIYAKNNFPIGVRVSLALQWGTVSGNTWTASSNPVSTVDLSKFVSNDWTFNSTICGYEYKCALPGNSATKGLFTNLSGLKTLIDAEAVGHSGEVIRLIVMVDLTYIM